MSLPRFINKTVTWMLSSPAFEIIIGNLCFFAVLFIIASSRGCSV